MVEVNKNCLSDETLSALIKDMEIVYLQTISWLVGYPRIVAKNDPEKEEDAKNLEELAKQKAKLEDNLPDIEAKIEYFKKLRDEI